MNSTVLLTYHVTKYRHSLMKLYHVLIIACNEHILIYLTFFWLYSQLYLWQLHENHLRSHFPGSHLTIILISAKDHHIDC